MKKMIIFSGAGMSAESGINTFRNQGGVWEQHDVRQVATPEAWKNNPALVQRFYNERRKHILDAQPNLAHELIAQFEDDYDVTVITQNIDDLHERAGSENVLHLHGNIRLAKSSAPHTTQQTRYYPIEGWELDLDQHRCEAGYPLRPHVVWFGEPVPAYDEAVELVQNADIFIVIGSTLTVYPVAGLVHEIPAHCEAYYIDPEANYSRVPSQYQLITATATDGVQQLFQQLCPNL